MRPLVPWLPLIGAVLGVVWVWAIFDIVRRPSVQWAATRHNRLLWVILVGWFGLFTLIPYLVWIRPSLERATPHDTPSVR